MTKIDLRWASVTVISVLLYRPLRFWAANAWTLSAPQDLFIVVALQVGLGLLLLALSALLPFRPAAVIVVVAWTSFIAMNWSVVRSPVALAMTLLIGAGVLLAATKFPAVSPRSIAHVAVIALVVTPVVQLVMAHLQNRPSLPVAVFSEPGPVTLSEQAHDVLVLVVDGYPMRRVASDMFGHDTTTLAASLEAHGFMAPEVSWSHNTFTGLSIPGMLSLDQVADPDAHTEWRNQRDNYAMSRGDNRAVQIFQSGGYRYTHIESGWNGDVCRASDVCRHNGPFDEATWKMLEHSLFIGLMEEHWGSQNAMNTSTSVRHLLDSTVFDDDRLDFVYAHMMLPHPPEVVDPTCDVLPSSSRGSSALHIRHQFACVDSMLTGIVESLPEDVLVLIAADHGTATRGQLFKHGDEWEDEDIAERMGALLAYRLPAQCDPPSENSNVAAMRAVVACTTDFPVPVAEARYLIGLEELTEVPAARIRRIEQGMVGP